MNVSININYGFRQLSIIANNSNNTFTVNEIPINSDIDSFIFKVCDIVLKWPTLLKSENEKIHDGTEVTICFENNSCEKKFEFINDLPEDFYKLEILLDEVEGKCGETLAKNSLI